MKLPAVKRIGKPRVVATAGRVDYCVETVEIDGQRFERWFVRANEAE